MEEFIYDHNCSGRKISIKILTYYKDRKFVQEACSGIPAEAELVGILTDQGDNPITEAKVYMWDTRHFVSISKRTDHGSSIEYFELRCVFPRNIFGITQIFPKKV